MQILPSPHLSGYIKHYLLLKIAPKEAKTIRHFSNGHCGLVFTLKKDGFMTLNTTTPLPDAYIFGQISQQQDFAINGAITVVIVVFQPYGLFRCTGIPSKGFQEQLVDAHLIFGKEIRELNERLKSSACLADIPELLNAYFNKAIAARTYAIAPFLQKTVALIHSRKGIIGVGELSTYACSSERKLQRVFAQQIGIAPKKFIQSVKLHSFLGLMETEYYKGFLTRSSLQAGYYDQAHLIREFKKITGLTPSRYQAAPSLAVNLIELE